MEEMLKLEPITKTNQEHAFDLVLDYKHTKQLVQEHGWNYFYSQVNAMFPERKLYMSTSQDWYDNRRYICKFKGACGDVLIGWYGAQVM